MLLWSELSASKLGRNTGATEQEIDREQRRKDNDEKEEQEEQEDIPLDRLTPLNLLNPLLEVAWTDRDAAIVLGTGASPLHAFLDPLGDGLREITGSHHAELLQEILDRRLDDKHRNGGKK